MRRSIALLGIGILALAALAGDGLVANELATAALVSLAIAVCAGAVEVLWPKEPGTTVHQRSSSAPRDWRLALAVAIVVSVIASQSWFHPGMSIAGGDIVPPNGLAWTSRLFEPWTWSGSNLGGPSALEQQLPWAFVLTVVHLFGGQTDLAQRAWFTLLYAGAMGACFALLTIVQVRPLPALIGALAYVLSPYVVANVVPNPVWLCSLALLPLFPTLILAAATGRIRVRTSAVLMGTLAPVIGYSYLNPPMLGAVLATALCTPALAAWIYGRPAARTAVAALVLGMSLDVLLSMYWIVPSAIQLVGTSQNQLATIASWGWTEVRSTVLNGFWLNTTWAWAHAEYFPISSIYDVQPLAIVRFAPALIAYLALVIGLRGDPVYKVRPLWPKSRVAIAAAGIAVSLILLSTGTNPPGNVVFDRLYSLPYGWLLREPGRFLIVADLAYSILIALTIEAILTWLRGLRELPSVAGRGLRLMTPITIALIVLLPGLPLVTGTIISDRRPLLPSSHVQVPQYWPEMAAIADSAPQRGAVLVLPLDDFYQMPYRWGYYGADTFISDLMKRPVLAPSPQGYVPASGQLLKTAQYLSDGIMQGNWQQVGALAGALDTPLILVRGDLDPTFPGRSFTSPALLASALLASPNFQLAHKAGPLELFNLRDANVAQTEVTSNFWTVNTTGPDLRALSVLPPHSALVSEGPSNSIPQLVEPPPVSNWTEDSTRLHWDFVERANWNYRFLPLGSGQAPADIRSVPLSVGGVQILQKRSGLASAIEMSVPYREVLSGGDFNQGVWQPVGDCADYQGPAAGPYLSAIVESTGGPANGPFLRLSAQLDSACEAKGLQWKGGPVLVTMSVRNVTGASPRVCLWEHGPNRCAVLPSLPDSSDWTVYRASTSPDAGTNAMDLFVYADVYAPQTSTENDYADIHVLELSAIPKFDLIESSPLPHHGFLTIDHNGFSPLWHASGSSNHVLVNGLINGWVNTGLEPVDKYYSPSQDVQAGSWLSLLGVVLISGIGFSLMLRPGAWGGLEFRERLDSVKLLMGGNNRRATRRRRRRRTRVIGPPR